MESRIARLLVRIAVRLLLDLWVSRLFGWLSANWCVKCSFELQRVSVFVDRNFKG